MSPQAPCDVDDNPDSLLDTWQRWVDAYNPDVVVYVARGETFDQTVVGRWQNLGQPAFDRYVESRYSQAAAVLGSKGASVVLMTTPYDDSGVAPAGGGTWPEDDPARVSTDNAAMRQAASAASGGSSGGKVYVFDLNAVVSPDERYTASVDQVGVRCADGVHFTRPGGIIVGVKLAPELVALGQSHAAVSPGGAWPGTLPPSTPTWFPNLPCQ